MDLHLRSVQGRKREPIRRGPALPVLLFAAQRDVRAEVDVLELARFRIERKGGRCDLGLATGEEQSTAPLEELGYRLHRCAPRRHAIAGQEQRPESSDSAVPALLLQL